MVHALKEAPVVQVRLPPSHTPSELQFAVAGVPVVQAPVWALHTPLEEHPMKPFPGIVLQVPAPPAPSGLQVAKGPTQVSPIGQPGSEVHG